jgi:hypothetical protein
LLSGIFSPNIFWFCGNFHHQTFLMRISTKLFFTMDSHQTYFTLWNFSPPPLGFFTMCIIVLSGISVFPPWDFPLLLLFSIIFLFPFLVRS